MAMKAIHEGDFEPDILVALVDKVLRTLRLSDNIASLQRLQAIINTFLNSADKRCQLALFYIILQQEISLQDFVEHELEEQERKFFIEKWLPHAVKLTEMLRVFALEHVSDELALYADNLASCWRLQTIAPQRYHDDYAEIVPISLLPRTRN